MRVKRYIVNTVPEALPVIRSELGKDAVILGTKEIYVGGFMGMFRKKKMEVIAAVESESPANPPPRTTAKGTATAAYTSGKAATAAAPVPTIRPEPPIKPAPDETLPSSVTPPAAAMEPLERPALSKASVARPSIADDVGQRLLMEEIREMKQMVSQWSKQQTTEPLSEPLRLLRQRLQDQEVAETWIDRLIAEVQADPAYAEDATLSSCWAVASRLLREWLIPHVDAGINEQVRIIQFVGPTGVGKTTTIAKLAADQTLRYKRKAGFITSDTYRIAAVDQLRTYANILNVPMEVVFSPAELSKAFNQLTDRDLIMVDTAGRNFRNTLYVSEVNSLLQAGEDCLTYLVLSLTSKSRDMAAVAEQFATFGVERVIFTKRDETDTIGTILNVVLAYSYKVAFIANGQTVPDDIDPFRPDNFVQQLLGEIPDE
ncbi:flagellar biosynthesis protein FlhF [Paenibacillus sp. 598K]|uniref:flagellar biosynthesis protein FlhF n=1 Tax=Paenibacillus sp. 598K TaxID=1117987 RepID=UPI000FFA265C|nr:flagellar biosynthesis protein FlhF [Paenibacillus sp. 598K]GBF72017.1 flagellar biosynthesis protein FlhF [Paenibacillus sp. 598K]